MQEILSLRLFPLQSDMQSSEIGHEMLTQMRKADSTSSFVVV